MKFHSMEIQLYQSIDGQKDMQYSTFNPTLASLKHLLQSSANVS